MRLCARSLPQRAGQRRLPLRRLRRRHRAVVGDGRRRRTSAQFVRDYAPSVALIEKLKNRGVRRLGARHRSTGRARCRAAPTRPLSLTDATLDEARLPARPTATTRSSPRIHAVARLQVCCLLGTPAEALAAARACARSIVHHVPGTVWPVIHDFWHGIALAANHAEAAPTSERDDALARAAQRAQARLRDAGRRTAPRTSCCQALLLAAEIARIEGRDARRDRALRAGDRVRGAERAADPVPARLPRAVRRAAGSRAASRARALHLHDAGARVLRAAGARRPRSTRCEREYPVLLRPTRSAAAATEPHAVEPTPPRPQTARRPTRRRARPVQRDEGGAGDRGRGRARPPARAPDAASRSRTPAPSAAPWCSRRDAGPLVHAADRPIAAAAERRAGRRRRSSASTQRAGRASSTTCGAPRESVVLAQAPDRRAARRRSVHRACTGRARSMCLPVQKQGRLVGVLYLENRARRRLHGRAHRGPAMLAPQAAIALENARLVAGLQREIGERQRRRRSWRRARRGRAAAGRPRGRELLPAPRPDRQRLARPAHAAGLDARLPRGAGDQGRRAAGRRSAAATSAIALRQSEHLATPDRRAVRAGQARLQGHARSSASRSHFGELASDVLQKFQLAAEGRTGAAARRRAAAPLPLGRCRPRPDRTRARQPDRQRAAAHAGRRPVSVGIATGRWRALVARGRHRRRHCRRRPAVHLRPLLPRCRGARRAPAAPASGLAITKRILELHGARHRGARASADAAPASRSACRCTARRGRHEALPAYTPAARRFPQSPPMQHNWPHTLWIVRHGQSAGNVARDAAEAAGLAVIDIAERDIDVPLSELGARRRTRWATGSRGCRAEQQPQVVLSSPYLRARQTAELVVESSAIRRAQAALDERLREKEFGILDRLTKLGIRQKHPELDAAAPARRQVLFPPARRRELVRRDPAPAQRARHDDARVRRPARAGRRAPGDRQLHALPARAHGRAADPRPSTAQGDVPNCAVTSYRAEQRQGRSEVLQLELVNFVAPLREAATPVTSAPDMPAAPKP